jgi:hypothetical protein
MPMMMTCLKMQMMETEVVVVVVMVEEVSVLERRLVMTMRPRCDDKLRLLTKTNKTCRERHSNK